MVVSGEEGNVWWWWQGGRGKGIAVEASMEDEAERDGRGGS